VGVGRAKQYLDADKKECVTKTKEEINALLSAKFYETFPKEQLPPWFGDYAVFVHWFDKDHKVVQLHVYLIEVMRLKKNEYWKEINGYQHIVGTYEETGKEYVVLKADNPSLTLFWAYIEPSLEITVSKALPVGEMAALKQEDFVKRDEYYT
jgi:hypothetical protein